jgi:hypothetical protein
MYPKYKLIGLAYQIFRSVSYPGNNSLLTWHQERTVVANCSEEEKSHYIFPYASILRATKLISTPPVRDNKRKSEYVKP